MTHTESRLEKLKLGQLLDVMINSDRIVIYDGKDNKSPVLYTGYVACLDLERENIDKTRIVSEVGLGAEFYQIDKTDNRFSHTKPILGEIQPEDVSQYRFHDLTEIIFTRIFLGGVD